MDDIVATLAQMTLDLSNTPSDGSATLDSVEMAFDRLTIDDAELTASASQHHSLSPPTGDVQRLMAIDDKLDTHMKNILVALDALAHPDPTRQETVRLDLLREQSNLRSTLHEVRGLDHHPSVEIQVLAEAMRERLEQFFAAIDIYLNILHERAPPPSNPRVVESENFIRNFHMSHKPSLVAILNVVAQNLFGHASRAWCNTNLRSFKLFWEEMSTEGGRAPSLRDDKLRNSFPTDLRTARSYLKIEPDTVTHAVCTKCSSVYPPKESKGILEWQAECTARRFPDSPLCGQPLVKSGVKEGKSVRVPIRPLVIQDFDAFVGRLLCRPGYEKLMDEATVLHRDMEELLDIKDGAAVQELRGPDGKPFLDGYKRSELRLIWSFSADGFNPFHNKQAGKKASCGSMAMVPLNLPPSLRHKAENIYLYTVMGGEPSLDDINHFIRPFVLMMQRNFQHGTRYTSTFDNPDHGRSTRSMMAVIISDLLGAKKILGHSGVTSKNNFCSFCTLSKSDIGNFDWQHWELRKVEDLRRAAELWRDAPSASVRKDLYAQYGVRWSAFWELSYFDPTRSVIIDGMHNLFEGLVSYHCRIVLGIDRPEETRRRRQDPPADPLKLAAAHSLLERNPRPPRRSLDNLTIPVLKDLCTERGLALPVVNRGKRLKKAEIVDVLYGFLNSGAQANPVPSVPPIPSHSQPLPSEVTPMIIGEGYIEDIIRKPNPRSTPCVGDDALQPKELTRLQKFLTQIQRPSWHTPTPQNLGEASHGKLKADQWRSAIEFDVTAAIAHVWSHDRPRPEDEERMQRRKLLVEATILLATAIQWATSYRTSKVHAARYMDTLVAYYNILKQLYPTISWRPNHHAALHIGPLLLRFGPMHGWWMFVYERVIGVLQKINTNFKIGQLEGTMLETFAASSHFKVLLHQHQDVPAVREYTSFLETAAKDRSRDPLAGALFQSDDSHPSISDGRGEPLSHRALAALASYYADHLPTEAFESYSKYNSGKIKFTTYVSSPRDCNIAFISNNTQRPGIIRFIVATKQSPQDILFIVERFASLPSDSVRNPFTSHVPFGASLWSDKMEDLWEAVPLQRLKCHTISSRWANGTLVIKALDRRV